MSGFVAIVARDRVAGIKREDLDGLVAAYEELRGAGERREVAAGDWAAAVQLASPGRRGGEIRRDGGSWSLIGGVAYGEAGAPARPERLDGQFGLLTYDARTDELTLAADAFAMHAVYAAERGDRAYVSTSALALARHLRAKPSSLGLELFLRCGYHFGSATHWEGIERLEPAQRLTFRDGRVDRSLYWRPSAGSSGESFAHAVERCRSALVETLERTLARRPALWSDLTGGYDSRLINLLLQEVGADFTTDTRGVEAHHDDVRIARRLAETVGWEWTNLRLPDDWPEQLPGYVRQAVEWGDGNLDALELARILHAHEVLGRRRPALVLGGGGEHYRGFAWRQEFFAAGRSTNVKMDNWIDMRLIHPLDTTVFAADPTPRVREDLRRRMVDWAEPYAGELNTTQLDVMYAYKVTGHFGAFRSADEGYLDSELPFYFRPIFAAGFQTDHRHRDRHRLMRQLIHELHPRAAALPTTAGGPAGPWRPTNLHRVAPYYAQLGRRAFAKLSQQALGRPLLAPRAWNDPRIALAQRDLVQRLDLRAGELRAATLYAPAAVDDLFRRAREGSLGPSALLGRIVTVELALRAADSAL